MVQGRTYLCKKLDLSSKVAVVRPADLKYYTKTRDFCDVHVIGGRTAYAKHTVCLPPPFASLNVSLGASSANNLDLHDWQTGTLFRSLYHEHSTYPSDLPRGAP